MSRNCAFAANAAKRDAGRRLYADDRGKRRNGAIHLYRDLGHAAGGRYAYISRGLVWYTDDRWHIVVHDSRSRRQRLFRGARVHRDRGRGRPDALAMGDDRLDAAPRVGRLCGDATTNGLATG